MKMRAEERVAKNVLEMAIPGARMVFREDQSNMEYDFELHYPNGEVAAVEVTTSRNPENTQIHNEIFGKNGGPGIKAVNCKRTWYITPSGTNIKAIRKDVDKYLADLEGAEIEGFDDNDCKKSNAPKEVAAIYRDLSVYSARSYPASGAAVILMDQILWPGQLNQCRATVPAEREIGPNKEKLGKAKTAERHLVVFVDLLNDSSWITTTSSEPPNEIPDLPKAITHLWQIAQVGEKCIVWLGTAIQPWHIVSQHNASEVSPGGIGH